MTRLFHSGGPSRSLSDSSDPHSTPSSISPGHKKKEPLPEGRGSFLSVLRTYRSYETWLIVNKALFFRTYVPEPTIRLHSSWTVPTAVAVNVPSTKTLREALEVAVPVPREVAVPGSV